MIRTLKNFENLCGTKHQEARQIAEDLYGELTRKIIIQNSKSSLEKKKPYFAKIPLDEQTVYDCRINPKLVKRRPENSLVLPRVNYGKKLPIVVK